MKFTGLLIDLLVLKVKKKAENEGGDKDPTQECMEEEEMEDDPEISDV